MSCNRGTPIGRPRRRCLACGQFRPRHNAPSLMRRNAARLPPPPLPLSFSAALSMSLSRTPPQGCHAPATMGGGGERYLDALEGRRLVSDHGRDDREPGEGELLQRRDAHTADDRDEARVDLQRGGASALPSVCPRVFARCIVSEIWVHGSARCVTVSILDSTDTSGTI